MPMQAADRLRTLPSMLMAPARTITLFADPPRPQHGSSSWLASLLVHVAGAAWVSYGLAHAPHVQNRTVHQRFTVRVLNAPMTKPEVRQYAAIGSPVHPAAPVAPLPPRAAASSAPSAPAPEPPVQAAAKQQASSPAAPTPARETPAPAAPAAIQLAQTTHQQQTLIQPDAPKDLLLQHPTPVPLVMMWAQHPPPTPVAAPPPKPVVANMHSSIAQPNREAAPAQINLSSTNSPTAMPIFTAGTTSPVVVRGPDPVKQMPTVAAESNTPPAPVRIISLSDRQQVEGPVAVPLANASAKPSNSQSLTAGKAENGAGTGRGNPTQAPGNAQSAGAAEKPGTGAGAGQARPSGNTGTKGAGAGGANGPATGASATGPSGGGPGIGSENSAAVKKITLPKDGKFGVVVVGSSLADQYPETAAIWAGRLVYTVYLHVGMGKSWILQYSLPAGTPSAAAGVRPDAPWPYDLVVPKLDADDYGSDALMVHGFVNVSGKFERLKMVLPPEFAQSKFVLNSLEQWQFRAAQQNGQPTPVEVLLIIPGQDE